MQKTANQIKSEFELLASGHYQIHSFLYAQEFEQQAYENLIYPLMLVYPLGGSLSGTSYIRNYRVVIADRVLKSEGNELEVESDTQLIALDTLAYWMKLGTNERFSITSSNTITPFWEKWGDEVTGHFVDIGIEEFYDFNSCAIPLSSAIPSPTNPCKDARILINSVVYGNAPSDTNFNVVVKDQLGALVGSLIGGEWIVNTGAGCPDASYTIEDSLGNVLYTGTIPSGNSVTEVISNSTLNVNKSDGTLISSRSILAEGTDSYNVGDSSAVLKDESGNVLRTTPIKATETEDIIAPNGDVSVNSVAFDDVLSGGTLNIQVRKSTGNDLIGSKQGQYWRIGDSTITNNAVSPTYSQLVKATEGLILPTQSIQNNGVASGNIPSVGTINVTTNVVPTSFTITGRTIDIIVPSGVPDTTVTDTNSYGLLLLPTKPSDRPTNYSQRALEWVDEYMNTLANPLTGTTLTNFLTQVDNLEQAGIWEKGRLINFIIGGTADDHKYNAKFPRNSGFANTLSYIGGATHSANGIELNGTSQILRTNYLISNLANRQRQISWYQRQSIGLVSGLHMTIGGQRVHFARFTDGNVYTSLDQSIYNSAAVTGAETQKLQTLRRNGTIGKYTINGTDKLTLTTGSALELEGEVMFGGQRLGGPLTYTNTTFAAMQLAYLYIGEFLSDSQESDHATIIQSIQTILGRQV
jgi:hypothetical protein